jgi:hypothetical protein
LNPRSQDPIVEGARVVSNNVLVAPARSSSVSSMLSPPASMDPITVSALAPLFAPWRCKVNRRSTSPASLTRCANTAAGAPRGASLYSQHSWEGLGGRFLGLMAYLDPKGEGDNSMPLKQRLRSGIRSGALRDPRDMAKAALPES